jgi:hypothetical protein
LPFGNAADVASRTMLVGTSPNGTARLTARLAHRDQGLPTDTRSARVFAFTPAAPSGKHAQLSR